jgi:U3 small nucleolar RNA-associated protein 15
MADFKALSVRHYAKNSDHLGPEALYWKKFSKQVLAQQIGPVTCVDFSPEEPHQYAVTSSTRVRINDGFDVICRADLYQVEIFDPNTQGVAKTVSRFKDVAYRYPRNFFKGIFFVFDLLISGTFRNDGKLLVAGGEDPLVQVFDIGSRAVLRSFSGHSA